MKKFKNLAILLAMSIMITAFPLVTFAEDEEIAVDDYAIVNDFAIYDDIVTSDDVVGSDELSSEEVDVSEYEIYDEAGDLYAATVTWPAKKNIKTYVKSTKNDTKVYKTSTSTDGGYGTIYASDLITINGYENGRYYVTYPISGGTKKGYVKSSDITGATFNVAKSNYTATAKTTTYRRQDGKTELGYISKGDTVYKIATSGSYAQVIYPVSGGYKMGWIYTGTTNNSAASSEEDEVTDKINKMMNGSYGSGVYKIGKKYTGPYSNEQCKGFAKQIHKELFGYLIGSTNSKPKNYTINISTSNTKLIGSVTSMTENNLKKVFTQARPGDFVQIRRNHGGPHSAIIVSASSKGIVTYEANLDGNNTISKNSYTWSQLINKNAAMSLYTAKSYKLK